MAELLLAEVAQEREHLERHEVVLVVAAFESFGVGDDHHARAVGEQSPDRRVAAIVFGLFLKASPATSAKTTSTG